MGLKGPCEAFSTDLWSVFEWDVEDGVVGTIWFELSWSVTASSHWS